MNNAERVKHWFRNVWCEPRDASLIDALLDDDLRHYGVKADGPGDKADFKALYEGVLATFRNFRIDVTHTIESGDSAAYFAVASGIHIPTGTPVKFTGTGIVTYRDGKTYEVHESWDFSTLLRQIGAVPDDAVAQALIGGAGG